MDILVHDCANVVTCVTLSSDCNVIGYGGIGGFMRAFNVASKYVHSLDMNSVLKLISRNAISLDVFRHNCNEGITTVALNSNASAFFVGKYKSPGASSAKVNLCLSTPCTAVSIEEASPLSPIQVDIYILDSSFDLSPNLVVPLRSLSYPSDIESIALSSDDLVLAVSIF